MTIIAWDGRTLAADSSTTIGNTIEQRPDSKITVLPDGRAFAAAGASADVQRFRAWMAGDGRPPPIMVEPQSFAALLCVPDADPTARVKCFLIEGDSLAYPMEVSGLQAIGAGRDFVLGAMAAIRAESFQRDKDGSRAPIYGLALDDGAAALAVMLACGRYPVYPALLHACGPVSVAKWLPHRGLWDVAFLPFTGGQDDA